MGFYTRSQAERSQDKLTGPTCPDCKITMRRRRRWYQWDRTSCRKCGKGAQWTGDAFIFDVKSLR